MCGRYTLHTPTQRLLERFQLRKALDLAPRFNIAPSQHAPVVRQSEAGRELVLMRWGLLPSWARDEKPRFSMINARAETVAEKSAYRRAFRSRRCLVPADGFYEWQAAAGGRQPWYIRMRDGSPIAFAGLWEHWEGAGGKVIESFTIIVTEPNDRVRPVHDRMPVILAPNEYALWLDGSIADKVRLQALLDPYPAEEMLAYPVSRRVNRPQHDDPSCIELAPSTTTG